MSVSDVGKEQVCSYGCYCPDPEYCNCAHCFFLLYYWSLWLIKWWKCIFPDKQVRGMLLLLLLLLPMLRSLFCSSFVLLFVLFVFVCFPCCVYIITRICALFNEQFKAGLLSKQHIWNETPLMQQNIADVLQNKILTASWQTKKCTEFDTGSDRWYNQFI